jgi:hypothetical protein
MANAPLMGQDGGSCKSDLADENSGIFFCEGLDDPNHVEFAREIRTNAHGVPGIPCQTKKTKPNNWTASRKG